MLLARRLSDHSVRRRLQCRRDELFRPFTFRNPREPTTKQSTCPRLECFACRVQPSWVPTVWRRELAGHSLPELGGGSLPWACPAVLPAGTSSCGIPVELGRRIDPYLTGDRRSLEWSLLDTRICSATSLRCPHHPCPPHRRRCCACLRQSVITSSEEHFSYDRPHVRPGLSNAKVPMQFVCAVDEALNSSVKTAFIARQHSRRSLLRYEVLLQGGLQNVYTNGRRFDAVQARKRACGYRSAKMHIAL